MASTLHASAVSRYAFPLMWLVGGVWFIYMGRHYPGSGMRLVGLAMIGISGWFLDRVARRH